MKPPRPDLKDRSLKTQALQNLLPQFLQWAEADSKYAAKAILYDLNFILESSKQDLDGYGKAKRLESLQGDAYFRWRPDSRLVYLLDQIPDAIRSVYDSRVEQWVQDNQILPAKDVGVKVELDGIEGIIQSIIHKEARYQVTCGGSLKGVPYEQVGG